MQVSKVYQLLKQKKFREAESLLIQLLQSRGDDSLLNSLLASTYLKQNRIAEALQLSNDILNRTDHPEAYAVKGLALLESGDNGAASECLDLSLALRDNPYYRSRLVQLYLKMKQLDDADRHLNILLENEPDNPYYLKMKSRLLSQKGKEDEALNVLKKTDETIREDPFEYSQFIRMKIKSKKAIEALDELAVLMAIPKHQNNPHLKTLFAEVQVKVGHYEEAERLFLEALNSLPENDYVRQRLGFLYARMNRPELVISFLSPHFIRKPGDVVVRKTLIAAFEKQGQYAQLLSLIDQALLKHPEIKALFGIKQRLRKKLDDSKKEERTDD